MSGHASGLNVQLTCEELCKKKVNSATSHNPPHGPPLTRLQPNLNPVLQPTILLCKLIDLRRVPACPRSSSRLRNDIVKGHRRRPRALFPHEFPQHKRMLRHELELIVVLILIRIFDVTVDSMPEARSIHNIRDNRISLVRFSFRTDVPLPRRRFPPEQSAVARSTLTLGRRSIGGRGTRTRAGRSERVAKEIRRAYSCLLFLLRAGPVFESVLLILRSRR